MFGFHLDHSSVSQIAHSLAEKGGRFIADSLAVFNISDC